MLRPTSSPIIYLQQLGRSLSVGLNDSPLVFDIVNNINCLEQVSNLKEEMEKVANRRTDIYGNKLEDDEINKRLIRLANFKVIDELKDITDSLKKAYEESNNTWEEIFELFKEYLSINNGRYPNEIEVYKGVKIGAWVNTQRYLYKKGKLFKEREE